MAIALQDLKIACIGAGYWGKNLIRNFNELGVLDLVCDTDESVLDIFETNYPKVRFCCSFSDVLSDPSIDAVVIAAPAEKHYALAREAFLAEKHVFVEKPLALRVEEGEELIAL
ncbi:MAG: Gfo/Idh/MocA family oxidoreductase, partial [Deltaproteobacteria bacterium]|nr:Gfo/Idh/MocA family oxidoreductase [Deltaproteobacteria bacterium]